MAVTWRKLAFEDDVVTKALFDAQTVLAATTDNTPAALAVGEQTVVGRITSGNIASLTVAQLQTLLFSAALAEDILIQFDEVLSADGKYSGFAVAGTAGTNLSFGQSVYLASADSKWELAKGNAEATIKPMTGIVCVAGNENAAVKILLFGTIREDDWSWTAGAPIFIDPDTAGSLTQTELTTGEYQKCVGWGHYTANEMLVVPNPDWVKVG